MFLSPTRRKYPEDSGNCDCDIFEEMPDGATRWRACVFGVECAESTLRELGRESGNKFFAINLSERPDPIIHRRG